MKSMGLKVSYGASFVHTHDVDAGVDETTGSCSVPPQPHLTMAA